MNRFLKKLGVIYTIIALIFLFLIYLLMLDGKEKVMFIFIFLYTVISLSIFIFALWFIRRDLIRRTNETCEFLDEVITTKTYKDYDICKDTLSSKEQNKIKELVYILETEKNRYEVEKGNIQSLITDLSHQIKTPLTNISMYNATILERKIDEETKGEFLNLMGEQISKLQWLVDGLIKISRLETELISLCKGEYFIEDSLAMALGGLYSKGKEKSVNISVNCDSAITAIFDMKWTSEALINIIENSIKYSEAGSNITIKVIPLEMFIRIDIKDEGIGIEKKEINNIFKRFYRSEDVREYKGIGIGLYLAREIISRQGGYIKVTSKKNIGSTFSVFLLKK